MKSYTDLEQSKRLAKILPIESADMWWNFYSVTTDNTTPQIIHLDTPWVGSFNWDNKSDNIPCWSLAALLDVLPSATLDSSSDHYYRLYCMTRYTEWYDNPIDACVAMIEKLHEQNLL